MGVIIDPENIEVETIRAFAGDLHGKRVLEIGCGQGRLTPIFAETAVHTTAIDPSTEKIEYAQNDLAPELQDRVTFLVQSLDDFQPTEQIDLVFLSWSL